MRLVGLPVARLLAAEASSSSKNGLAAQQRPLFFHLLVGAAVAWLPCDYACRAAVARPPRHALQDGARVVWRRRCQWDRGQYSKLECCPSLSSDSGLLNKTSRMCRRPDSWHARMPAVLTARTRRRLRWLGPEPCWPHIRSARPAPRPLWISRVQTRSVCGSLLPSAGTSTL